MGGPKTIILTNNALTRKRWARDLFKRVMPTVEFNFLTGSGTDSIVQVNNDLGKGEGDQVTFGIDKDLIEDGQVGNESVEGNEERQRFTDFSITIEELNKAVDTGGKMEAQRIPYDLMIKGRAGLQKWWGQRLSYLVINTLCGNSAYVFNGCAMNATGTCFANVITEPDIKHALAVGQTVSSALTTSEAAMTSSEVMTLGFLDKMKELAEVPHDSTCQELRPLNLKGKNYFRVVMHDYVFNSLRRNTNVGEWGDLLRSANKLQIPAVEIEYNGMLISKSSKCPQTVVDSDDSTGRSGIYRTILCGAQAGVWAWGGAGDSKSSVMSFVPYTRDAERFTMIRGGGILGCKKVVFDDLDYGVITGSSYAHPTQE